MLSDHSSTGNSFFYSAGDPQHSNVPPCGCAACVTATRSSDAAREAIIAALVMADPQFSAAGIHPRHWSITSLSTHAGAAQRTMSHKASPL